MAKFDLDTEILKTRQEFDGFKSYLLIGTVPLSTSGTIAPSSGDLHYMGAMQKRFCFLDKRLRELLSKKAQLRSRLA